MTARYLVDGYCLDEAVAYKMYFSSLKPVVLNDALSFPELANNQLSFGSATVDLSTYLARCDGDFVAIARSDFSLFSYVLLAVIGFLLVARVIGMWNASQRGGDE